MPDSQQDGTGPGLTCPGKRRRRRPRTYARLGGCQSSTPAAAALAWLYLLGRAPPVSAQDQRLPPGARDRARDPARWPSVVAVADPGPGRGRRDPAGHPAGPPRPGNTREFSVVLVDDASTDGTAATAAALAAGTGRALLVTAGPTPAGWARFTPWPRACAPRETATTSCSLTPTSGTRRYTGGAGPRRISGRPGCWCPDGVSGGAVGARRCFRRSSTSSPSCTRSAG